MSIDSDDSPFEQALRGDLPSPDAQARVRRRLLAAGVAVGNGVAATTAAAAGATPTVVSGVVGKALAMSWGVKLGALAVVTIPTVGLLVDSGPSAPALSAPAPVAPKLLPAEPARVSQARTSSAPSPSVPKDDSEQEDARDTPIPPTLRSPVLRDAAPVAASPRDARPQPAQGAFEQTEPALDAKGTTLAEETRLLDSALRELASGNAARAADLIGEHERRFPGGLLKQERQRAKLRLAEISRGE